MSFQKVKFEEAEEEEKNIQNTWQFYLDFQSPHTIINNDSLFLYKTREVVTHLWDKIPYEFRFPRPLSLLKWDFDEVFQNLAIFVQSGRKKIYPLTNSYLLNHFEAI